MNIRKNDTVLVITGEFKGRKGRVLEVDTKKQRVLVEGINMMKKHTKANQRNQHGGIVEREAPSAVVVPLGAVQSDGHSHFVFVREADRFVRRSVQLGTVDALRAEIRSGLEVGEQIAVEGSHVLKADLINRS